jgi:uncharacterized repeat protein (TIGR01451 family)
LSVLHNFAVLQIQVASTSLFQGVDGAFYGLTPLAGANGAGIIYRFDPSTSAFTTLHEFSNADGGWPFALVQGADTALYGVATQGGWPQYRGTVFRYDLGTSTLTTLHTFAVADGQTPSSLLQGPDGLLYGVAQVGGAHGGGTLFRLSTLPPPVDVSITKSNGRTTVNPGQPLSYTISVDNRGPEPVQGVTVTDVLPATLSGGTWTCVGTGSATCTASGTGSINDAAVKVAPGGAVTYTLSATVDAAARGSLSNTASVTLPSGMTDPALDNNIATDTDAVIAFADLTIQKTDGQTTVANGQAVSYTITVRNLGPDSASGATVTDTLPDILTGATWTCTPSGGASCTASGSGGIGDTAVNLSVGGSATYSLTAILSASATGSLSNTASVAVPDGFTDSVLGNNTATDTDAIADQTPPVVTVVAPRGGEIILSGSAYVVEWTASDNVALTSFEVAVSRDGGATFAPIAGCTDLAGSARSCLWAQPAPAAAAALVRVTARDSSGNSGTDVTDSSLRIGTGTGSITVTRPARAERWVRGTIQTIHWSHNLRAGSTVDIEISRDAGETWTLVAESVANQTGKTGRYDWLVTGPATTLARVRVSWAGNPNVQDVSEGRFVIEEPAITVTTPNAAPSWKIGQTYRVRWAHNLRMSQSVNIAISRDGGGTWTPIAANRPNTALTTGYYDWVVAGPSTTQARIRVSWTGDAGVSDVSNVDFTIRP